MERRQAEEEEKKKSEENPETVGKSDNELLREIEVLIVVITSVCSFEKNCIQCNNLDKEKKCLILVANSLREHPK